MNEHISKQFDADLELIRSKVLEMGGMVEHQLRLALQAFNEGNKELAEKVIGDDDQVNQAEVALDRLCNQVIMRRQPTANDLRSVFASIKMITDLERVGDEAAKVARFSIRLHQEDGIDASYIQKVEGIGQKALNMLQSALDAYARLDTKQAMYLIMQDDDLDENFREITGVLIQDMEKNAGQITDLLDLLWTVKAIERIGDHAKNLGEYVVYIVEGKDIRHAHITI